MPKTEQLLTTLNIDILRDEKPIGSLNKYARDARAVMRKHGRDAPVPVKFDDRKKVVNRPVWFALKIIRPFSENRRKYGD